MSEIVGYNLEQRFEASKHIFLDSQLKAYIRLQHDYGLRVSDMLKINYKNIQSDLSIIVKQSKNSNTLNIYPRSDLDIWRSIKANCLSPMDIYSRFSIYRLYKKLGLSLPSITNGNQSVTHSARKIKAQQIYNDTKSVQDTAATLGHKRTTSTMYYLTAEQKRLELKHGILNNPVGECQGIKVNKNGVIRFVTDIK